MDEWTSPHVLLRWARGVINHRVADVAVVANYFAVLAHVLAVMATKAAGKIKMADVVRVRLPISLHLREKISLKDSLDLFHGRVDRRVLRAINIWIIRTIKIGERNGDRIH